MRPKSNCWYFDLATEGRKILVIHFDLKFAPENGFNQFNPGRGVVTGLWPRSCWKLGWGGVFDWMSKHTWTLRRDRWGHYDPPRGFLKISWKTCTGRAPFFSVTEIWFRKFGHHSTVSPEAQRLNNKPNFRTIHVARKSCFGSRNDFFAMSVFL